MSPPAYLLSFGLRGGFPASHIPLHSRTLAQSLAIALVEAFDQATCTTVWDIGPTFPAISWISPSHFVTLRYSTNLSPSEIMSFSGALK